MRIPFQRALVALGLGPVALSGCAGAERAPAERLPIRHAVSEAREELAGVALTRRDFVLEGELRVTAAAPDSATAEAAMKVGLAAADSVERLLSRHVRGSEIAAINRAAGREPVRVGEWTLSVLSTTLEWAEATDGAFDPTVGPLLEVWGFGGGGAHPDSASVATARALVGWDKVEIDRAAGTVFLPVEGMVLDLRAAIRGFALDRMVEAMTAAGATAGIAALDGDLVFFGPGTESSSDRWPIDLPDPYSPNHAMARLELPPGGLSTSEFYDRQVEVEGTRVGDLIDPLTGRPITGIASVSVYAPDALLSDLLSTALTVMGPGRGRRLVEARPGVDVVFVREAAPGEEAAVVVTNGLRPYLKELRPPVRPLEREDW